MSTTNWQVCLPPWSPNRHTTVFLHYAIGSLYSLLLFCWMVVVVVYIVTIYPCVNMGQMGFGKRSEPTANQTVLLETEWTTPVLHS